MKEIRKKLKLWWQWYIQGYYHCDKCPMCWSEWSYEGDNDCGCYLFGDIRDTCRLLPPFRQLIGWPKKRKAEYWEEHQYDGIEDVLETEYLQSELLERLLREAFSFYEFAIPTEDGKLTPASESKERLIEMLVPDIRFCYENEAHPVTYTPLKAEWKQVLRRTSKEFLDIFRPFLPRRKESDYDPDLPF